MRSDRDKRMAFCASVITKKIEASILTLEKVIRKSEGKGDATSLFGFDAAG